MGSINPADIATREFKFSTFNTNQLWWTGPEFLISNEQRWPEDKDVHESPDVLIESKRATTASKSNNTTEFITTADEETTQAYQLI